MERYSIIDHKDPREIVLLKSNPCIWGKCSFCDYIEDNSTDQDQIIKTNKEVLSKVKGTYKKLEVINSGSVFELPQESLEDLKDQAAKAQIHTLVFEIYLAYRKRFDEIRSYFKDTKVEIKSGIETFDDDFRKNVLNKPIKLGDLDDLAKDLDVICLMVGIEGQTMDMVRRDMDLSRKFDRVAINIYRNNSTKIKRDDKIVQEFVKEYGHLKDDPRYDILMDPTDFGVGD